MQEKAKEPEIRFAGFTGAWEQRKIGDYLTLSKIPGHTGVDAKKLTVKLWGKGVVEKTDIYGGSQNTQYYVRRAGQFMYGKLDFLHAAFGIVPKSLDRFESTLDSPAFDLHEIDGAFLQNRVTQQNFYLKFGNIANGSRKAKRIHEVTFLDMPIVVPSYAEQKKIGAFLNKLDSLLTLHQRKYEKLLNIKKSMLEKMFPKEGEVVPEIRFKGFTGAWEQRKLGALLDEYKVSIPTPHDGYTRLGIRSHAKGTFHEYVPKGRELETKEMNKVAKDKLILNITFAWEHAVAITDEKDEGALVSHRFPQFTLHPEIIPNFLKYVILDESFRHHLYLASPGGAGRNRVLKISQMLEYAIKYPSTAEQLRISNLLDSINSLITLHQRKLEMLKNVKQAFLEKMFV